MQLDSNKATGIDSIGPKILKNCALSLYQPLCHLFNVSLSTGCIPHEWKIHKIVPIHKSADRSSVTNYRPISLLSNASKILEQLIHNKLINHVSNIISTRQFGFMRGRSTVQQLLLFLDYIYDSISVGSQVDAIYLDIRKAFDSVPHYKLLLKLWENGIVGKLWDWFRTSGVIFLTVFSVSVSITHIQTYYQFYLECLKGAFLARCFLSFILMTCSRHLNSPVSFFLQMMPNCANVFPNSITPNNYNMIYTIYMLGVYKTISVSIFLNASRLALIVSIAQHTPLTLNAFHN